jgi:hypothetical protein
MGVRFENYYTEKKVSYTLLESLVGRLNHTATACPIMRYFLGRIRALLTNWDVSKTTKKVERYLSSQVLDDFRLWKDTFLPAVAKGISLNLITYHRPTGVVVRPEVSYLRVVGSSPTQWTGSVLSRCVGSRLHKPVAYKKKAWWTP